MVLRIGTVEYGESYSRFLKHLAPGSDADLLLLKGHLLIEVLLEKCLSQRLASPGRLKDARLTFAQKLFIVSALSCEEGDNWLWDVITLLNRLRNDLVHNVDKPAHGALLQSFLLQVESSEELPHLEPPGHIHERLHRALFSVHEAMSHRVDL